MDILNCTAVELVQRLKGKQITAEALTRFYLDRIEKHRALNAVAEINGEALSAARDMDNLPVDERGMLCGLPILIKDNIDVMGMRTTAGSAALADSIAQNDAPVVANLRRNGAIILGKTNLTEFANYTADNMPNGFSSHGGQVVSAYDPDMDPSGSSTGSAVAVSMGICAAAIGTDTSFSIVGCATDNGVTGYKPPIGALSTVGIVPIAHSLDSAGPITIDVRDAILIYSAMRDEPLPEMVPMNELELNLAMNMHKIDEVSDEQRGKYEQLLKTLDVKVNAVSHGYMKQMGIIMRNEFRHDLEAYLADTSPQRKTLAEIIAFYEANPEHMPYGISILKAAQDEGRMDSEEYLAALADRERLRAEAIEELEDHSAIIMAGVTNYMHLVGMPSIALRLGMADNGHPRGLILYGTNERRLLMAALLIEQYCEKVERPKKF